MGEPAPRRVLVVEDDAGIRQVLREALAMEGYDVREAPDGAAALAALAAWRPDVIVLDLMMPVMDGWRLRAELLARPELRELPVIVVSASRHLDARTAELRAAAVLPKPFDVDRLIAEVERLAS
jgi:CheY-like chemotaxis protein